MSYNVVTSGGSAGANIPMATSLAECNCDIHENLQVGLAFYPGFHSVKCAETTCDICKYMQLCIHACSVYAID